MATARNNHYVPRWYQKRFLEPGRATLAYLDLNPEVKMLDSGRLVSMPPLTERSTKGCFFQTDWYSTFFGTAVNDEIERLLFGDIDTRRDRSLLPERGR